MAFKRNLNLTKMRLTLFMLLMTIAGLNAQSQDANRFFPEKDLVTTGIYYYPEHWNENQWERDIKKISEMGFEFVHLAEFAWYKMEPKKGNMILHGWMRWLTCV